MNLKEAFRYQNFLDKMMSAAEYSICVRDHALVTTKVHNKTKSDPEATDITETVEVEPFFPNDDVIFFMQWLIIEREKLTKAIVDAKAAADIPTHKKMLFKRN